MRNLLKSLHYVSWLAVLALVLAGMAVATVLFGIIFAAPEFFNAAIGLGVAGATLAILSTKE